jgi:hypothetical protein
VIVETVVAKIQRTQKVLYERSGRLVSGSPQASCPSALNKTASTDLVKFQDGCLLDSCLNENQQIFS